VPAAVGLLPAFAFGMGWIWTAIALVTRLPRAIMSIGLTVLFPLTFASNVFVEPTTMPSWLHTFVDINPISHLVTVERGLKAGTATTGQLVWVLLAGAGLTALFALLAMRLYRNKGLTAVTASPKPDGRGSARRTPEFRIPPIWIAGVPRFCQTAVKGPGERGCLLLVTGAPWNATERYLHPAPRVR
jgi:ABC-2 type transporter